MDERLIGIKDKPLSYGRGYVYSIQYHIVWCTKYRCKVLIDGIDVRLKEMLNRLAEEYRFSITALEVMPDHVHMLQSGKIYNCDLNACYNIGARYYVREILKTLPETERQRIGVKIPACVKRSTCTLATLISLNGELHGVSHGVKELKGESSRIAA